MPQLGESIAEAVATQFLVTPGESVQAGQDVLEVETNKASLSVTSPCSGTVSSWMIKLTASYPVGSVLGYVETTDQEAEQLGITTKFSQAAPPENDPAKSEGALSTEPDLPIISPTIRSLPVPAHVAGATYMSPRMKARMQELGLHAADLAGIAGSGGGGRVTIEDFEKYLANLQQQKLTRASSMRVAVADAMRRSWTRPLATVGLEVNMDMVLTHRKQFTQHPGPALYALRALAIALSENSAPGGRLVGHQIVHPRAIDLGFAVEAVDGVLVPVIRNADRYSLADLNPRYIELVELARQRRLPADATGGSIATVTNYGTFGLLWATPIPLPEQTLVLGLGAGRKMPFWDASQSQFIPVTQACLTLSFDHRVLDGGAAGRLLTRVANLMQEPEKL